MVFEDLNLTLVQIKKVLTLKTKNGNRDKSSKKMIIHSRCSKIVHMI